jgi:restriction system protein
MAAPIVSVLDAAETVLRDADGPLNARQITERALDRGLWQTFGRTPEQTMASRLAVDIRDHGGASRFQRVDRGLFTLNPDRRPAQDAGDRERRPRGREARPAGRMSFLDAAEALLRRSPDQTPMHYREITERSLEEGLIESAGRTPDATLRAQIGVENRRREARGDRPRFLELGRGLIGLSEWQQDGILLDIERHNEQRRAELLDRVRSMDPRAFEQLIAELLSALGFEIISITPYGGDGGVDVRAELLAGGVMRIRVAIQVKRWANNVRAPTVRELRGSLGAHERGMIVTTSDFSAGARDESLRQDAQPVAPMTGQELVALLVETELGVRRSAHAVIELAAELPGEPEAAADRRPNTEAAA